MSKVTQDLLLAQAQAQMNKPPQVKSVALLAALIDFAENTNLGENSLSDDDSTNTFPYNSKTASAINTLIKKTPVLNGRVWAINNDDHGAVLVNVGGDPS